MRHAQNPHALCRHAAAVLWGSRARFHPVTQVAPVAHAEMARDLAPDVEKLLEQTNGYVRKKAALCAVRWVSHEADPWSHAPPNAYNARWSLCVGEQWASAPMQTRPAVHAHRTHTHTLSCTLTRVHSGKALRMRRPMLLCPALHTACVHACRRIVRKAPELAEIFAERVVDLLHDQRNQAVQLCGVTLMLEVRPPARTPARHARACAGWPPSQQRAGWRTHRHTLHACLLLCCGGWCSAAPCYAMREENG